VAGLVAAVTLLLTVMVLLRDRRPAPAGLAVTALCLVVAQALLGGARVQLGETNSYGVATLHAFTAQVFLGAASALLGALSLRHDRDRRSDDGRALMLLFLATAVAAALQAFMGAGFRHKVLGFVPHGIGALAVVALVIVTFRQARRRARGAPAESPAGQTVTMSRLAAATAGALVLLGAASWLLLKAGTGETSTAAATVVVAVLHLGLGSALILETVTGAFRAAAWQE
jgi:hypothetical protein